MASLNTFGAILTYAIELESQLNDYYQALGDSDRAKAADKRRKSLNVSVVKMCLKLHLNRLKA